MANLHLVTGYAGYEHIKATDQAAFNAALIGTGQFVLEKGGIFEAQVQTNNLVRVLDGELMMQGRFIRLDPDTYVDLEIENGEQGKLRNDIIVARYTKDIGTGVEECNLVVIKGEAVASDPVDPAHEEGDITNGVGTVHDYPLWRIPIDGLNVGEPESLFGTPFMDSMHTLHSIREDVNAQLEEQKDYFAEQEALYEAAFEEQNEKFQKSVDAFGGYTKKEVLSSDTKTVFGLSEDAIPDDVFKVLSEAPGVKIGDVKITARTDLGDKWLLCNGAKVSVDFPALYEASEYKFALEKKVSTSDTVAIRGMAYHNGTWVMTGYSVASSSSPYPYVFVTDDLDGTWTAVKLSASISCYTRDVVYNDGTWYVMSYDKSGSGGRLWYATDPYGSWSYKSTGLDYLQNLLYVDGVWYSVKIASNQPYIVTATDPLGSWTSVTDPITTTSADTSSKLYYANGTWVFVRKSTSSSGASAIYIATDPKGSWTYVYGTNESGVYSGVYLTDICYNDGVWVAVGYTYSGGTLLVCTSEDANTWTEHSISTTVRFDPRVKYNNGTWAIVASSSNTEGSGYVCAKWTTDPTGTWKTQSLSDDTGSRGRVIVEHDGGFVIGGHAGTATTAVYPRIYSLFKCLPTITCDNAYAYIKAKE